MMALELGTEGTFTFGRLLASSMLFRVCSYVPGSPRLTKCACTMHVIILVEISEDRLKDELSCGWLVALIVVMEL